MSALIYDGINPPRQVCDGCGQDIDPDCCGCGDSREGHNSMWSGHSFVPMGCDCMRSRSQSDRGTEHEA